MNFLVVRNHVRLISSMSIESQSSMRPISP
jgi:hypothetical protein